MARVSVILPSYNCANYLPDSIASVLSQTFRDIELLIVDDGSTDDTEAMIKRGYSDPRIVYVKQNHAGLSSARNRGIDLARGEYIAFLDADDLFVKDKIERQLAVFDRNGSAAFVYTSERYFYDDNKDRLFDSPHEKPSGDLLFFLKRSNFMHISTVMVRKVITEGTRFDTALKSHEDWDFFLKLSGKRVRFYYLPEGLTLVRVRSKSMTAEAPTMDSSREIVGERGREIWRALKDDIDYRSKKGWGSLYRYISLKARAGILNFPNAPRFNRPSLFKPGRSNF